MNAFDFSGDNNAMVTLVTSRIEYPELKASWVVFPGFGVSGGGVLCTSLLLYLLMQGLRNCVNYVF